MSKVSKQIEVAVHVDGTPETLARLMTTVGSAGSQLLACCNYQNPPGAAVLLVTDDPRKTVQALEAGGFPCKTNTVVVIETAYHQGLAVWTGRQLTAAGIAVLYSYVYWEEKRRTYAVFKTADDDRTFQLLKASLLAHDVAGEKSANDSVMAQNSWLQLERKVA